jgi:hypothetical protein
MNPEDFLKGKTIERVKRSMYGESYVLDFKDGTSATFKVFHGFVGHGSPLAGIELSYD